MPDKPKKPRSPSLEHQAATVCQELTRLNDRLASLTAKATEVSAERDALLKSTPPDVLAVVTAMRAAMAPKPDAAGAGEGKRDGTGKGA